MAEERDKLMQDIFTLQAEVKRLIEHERDDKPKYERWHKEILDHLKEIEKLIPTDLHKRLLALEARPIPVQVSAVEMKTLFDKSFDERMEVWVGRMAIRVAVAMILTFAAGIVTSVLVYFGFIRR